MTCVIAATLVAGLAPAGAEEATTGVAPAATEEATTASSRPAAPMPAPPPAPVTPKTGFVPGTSTEDDSKRTARSKTFRNPDGSHTDQISGDVQHYWTGNRWADISNRLVADPGGGYRNQANSFTARFRSSEASLETPQGTITLKPAGATLGAPVVDSAGETVTYPDVWPGVDVRYRVHGTGVKEELVLQRRPSMSQFPFQVQGTSLTPQPDGSLKTSGAFAGKWEVSPPVVFAKDGSTVPAAAPRFSVAGATVTLAVDGSWLSGLEDGAFPVVLDPSVHSVGAQTSRSYERNPNDNGYSTCEQPCQVMVGIRDWANGWRPWRSVQYFPYENLYGKQIIKGQLIYQARQEGTPDPKIMKVYGDDVNGQWGGIWNWGNLGAHLGSADAVGDSFIFDGANGGPLAGYYQDLVNRRLPFLGLKFVGDETFGNYTFKRFAWFQLQLTYNDPPDRPYYIAPVANATLNYQDPWLVANNNDPNGDNVALHFRLYREADGAYMGGKNGGFTCNGCQDSWYAGPLANGRYFWDEWAWDGWLDSPGVRNYFTIAVPPSPPQNVVATPNGSNSAGVTWTPPASSGGSAIDWYAVNVFYASNGAWTGQQVTVCGTCTSATITGLAFNTGYYFGAYGHNSAGYGNPGYSNTITMNQAPYAPTNLVPGGGAVVTSPTPTLSATHTDPDGSGGTLHVELRDAVTDAVLIADGVGETVGNGGTFRYTVPAANQLVDGKAYEWRARASDVIQGGYGPWSPYTTFIVDVASYQVVYSTSPSRLNPLPLNGATVGGPIYVFLSPSVGAVQTDWWWNDQHQEGAPVVRTAAPYDALGTDASGAPVVLDTTGADEGLHTFDVLITMPGGGDAFTTAAFTVNNVSAAQEKLEHRPSAGVYALKWPMTGQLGDRAGPRDVKGGSSNHPGVDINATPEGAPVFASYQGLVQVIDQSDCGSRCYGLHILVEHRAAPNEPLRYKTRYAHLKKGSATVSTGQTVAQGAQLGTEGNTGSPPRQRGSTNIHLHFEVEDEKGAKLRKEMNQAYDANNGPSVDPTKPFKVDLDVPPAEGTAWTHLATTTDGNGYWMVNGAGRVEAFGNAAHKGDLRAVSHLPVSDIASPSTAGYWLVTADGQVSSFGVPSFGNASSPASPITAMAAHPGGKGYWLVAANGQVFHFGSAKRQGDALGLSISSPIVDIVATPSGRGFWLVSSQGEVFHLGDAGFFGHMKGTALNAPVAGMDATPDGQGYRLIGQDGGVFNFGNATAEGAAPTPARFRHAQGSDNKYTSIETHPTDPRIYWLTLWNGAVTGFNAPL